MSKKSVPIKQLLSAIDHRKKDFYDKIDHDTYKIEPWLAMRWASSVGNKVFNIVAHHLLLTNDFVNVHFNVLSKHPKLQWLLLTITGTKTGRYHQWIPPGKRGKKDKLKEFVYINNPTWNEEELELFFTVNTKKELEEYVSSFGLTPKQTKELFGKS